MLRNYKEIQLDKLAKFENNSRTHSEAQIEQIIASIKEFGFTNPLLVDENNLIIAGHGRLEAALRLGLPSVACIVLEGYSEEQKRAMIIADNKLALNAGWDEEKLRTEIDWLKERNYNTDFTGFSTTEIEDLFPIAQYEGKVDDDEIPDIVAEPVSKPGDLWIMGGHRIVCGDSTVSTDVEKLLGGEHPNTMITDPPYGVKYEADWRSTAKNRKKTERENTSSLSNDDRADWYDAYVLFPGNVAYVWHASAFTDIVMDGLRRAGFEVKQQIIWNKNVHTLSRSDYHWKHEPCWYAIKESKSRNWKGGRNQMTVWDVPSIIFDKEKTAHPTQKPVELYLKALEHHTNPGEYVYDPFGRSGTLMVACEKIQRKALMMELDPKFVDLILQRYKTYTGKDPKRDDGKTYSELRK